MRLMTDEIPSAIGTLVIVALDERLCGLDYDDCRPRMLASLTRRFGVFDLQRTTDPGGMSTRLRRYFHGDLEAIDGVSVETGGTALQRRVWAALRGLRPGTTVTYGDLARDVGRPSAARAIGMINGQNPVAIVVPCHRVVGADASPTGYAGGLWRKRWLLHHEGAVGPWATEADSA